MATRYLKDVGFPWEEKGTCKVPRTARHRGCSLTLSQPTPSTPEPQGNLPRFPDAHTRAWLVTHLDRKKHDTRCSEVGVSFAIGLAWEGEVQSPEGTWRCVPAPHWG